MCSNGVRSCRLIRGALKIDAIIEIDWPAVVHSDHWSFVASCDIRSCSEITKIRDKRTILLSTPGARIIHRVTCSMFYLHCSNHDTASKKIVRLSLLLIITLNRSVIAIDLQSLRYRSHWPLSDFYLIVWSEDNSVTNNELPLCCHELLQLLLFEWKLLFILLLLINKILL